MNRLNSKLLYWVTVVNKRLCESKANPIMLIVFIVLEQTWVWVTLTKLGVILRLCLCLKENLQESIISGLYSRPSQHFTSNWPGPRMLEGVWQCVHVPNPIQLWTYNHIIRRPRAPWRPVIDTTRWGEIEKSAVAEHAWTYSPSCFHGKENQHIK